MLIPREVCAGECSLKCVSGGGGGEREQALPLTHAVWSSPKVQHGESTCGRRREADLSEAPDCPALPPPVPRGYFGSGLAIWRLSRAREDSASRSPRTAPPCPRRLLLPPLPARAEPSGSLGRTRVPPCGSHLEPSPAPALGCHWAGGQPPDAREAGVPAEGPVGWSAGFVKSSPRARPASPSM